MKPSEILIARIKRECGITLSSESKIIPTRAGKWQRAAGAWRWEIHKKELFPQIGSQYRVRDLLKAERLIAYRSEHLGDSGTEIYIDPFPAIRAEEKARRGKR